MRYWQKDWFMPAFLVLIIIGPLIYYATHPGETVVLRRAVPDAIQFYKENAALLDSLVEIQKEHEHEGENGHWTIYLGLDGSLQALGLPHRGWDSVSLFDSKEKKIIETAFSASYHDISIRHFDSHGRIWVKSLDRYYMEIMFLPDEESQQYWIQDKLVQYSEPISDGWYVLIQDGRPTIA